MLMPLLLLSNKKTCGKGKMQSESAAKGRLATRSSTMISCTARGGDVHHLIPPVETAATPAGDANHLRPPSNTTAAPALNSTVRLTAMLSTMTRRRVKSGLSSQTNSPVGLRYKVQTIRKARDAFGQAGTSAKKKKCGFHAGRPAGYDKKAREASRQTSTQVGHAHKHARSASTQARKHASARTSSRNTRM